MMMENYKHTPEPKPIPLICSYCKCDIRKGDKVAVVQDGEITDVFNPGFSLKTDWDTTQLFHKVCDWMKNGSEDDK